MEFLMIVAADPEAEPYVAEEDTAEAWVEEMDGRGVRVRGNRLHPAERATTVRRRGGRVLVTDGPFAETKETILGYDVLECASLEEAIEVAAKHPMARFGRLELRPAWPFDPDEGA
ncbi:YciI family protein [Naasia aerilata]|uniref:Transcription initiation protein n=1 Tax=Naasia aerilata TaxID=1162966 RepID=A0ABN6XI97_9MICO|nr:YciI family protein [Naasia aerilata]BDZ44607.1 transcription initiation protein [Naasia aerilata]